MLDEFNIKDTPDHISNLLKFYLNSLNSYDLERLLNMYQYEFNTAKNNTKKEDYSEIIEYLEKIIAKREEKNA